MKNKSTILIMALAVIAAFTGCKKNEIDIETELEELSEETFQSLEYCSHVDVNGYNMNVIQFHFNHADNTVEKVTFSLEMAFLLRLSRRLIRLYGTTLQILSWAEKRVSSLEMRC